MSNSTDDPTSVFNHLFEKLYRLCDELHQDTREIQETTNSTNDGSSATHYLWTPATSGDKSILLPTDTSTPKLARTVPNLCSSASDKAFTLSCHGKTHTVSTTINVPIHWSNGKVKSVQSALSDLKRPPERLQSQCNYRLFITQQHLNGMLSETKLLPNLPERTDNGKLPQFNYSRSLITNRGTAERGIGLIAKNYYAPLRH